jgi:hypothetical protein
LKQGTSASLPGSARISLSMIPHSPIVRKNRRQAFRRCNRVRRLSPCTLPALPGSYEPGALPFSSPKSSPWFLSVSKGLLSK